MTQSAISAFVMLFTTIGPLEAAAIFAALTAGRAPEEQRKIAFHAVAVAAGVLLVFALGGAGLLELLHIGMPAFRLAGGLLLLLAAIDLMFAHPTGLTSITSAEAAEAGHRDIAVFPLAIPLIAGPGSIAAIVLLVGEAPSLPHAAVVTAMLLVVLGLTFLGLILSRPITRLLGVTGVNVVARVSGVILAALAMQLIIDGVRTSGMFAPAAGASQIGAEAPSRP